MSETAVFRTAEALRDRIGLAIDGGASQVYIGAPVSAERDNRRVSLFLFHTQVCQSLRNEPYFRPPVLDPASAQAELRDALPLDLRFLVTVFRKTTSGGVDPPEATELTTLGQVMQILHSRPNLGGEPMGGQVVRVTLEPYPMEEISRVWGLFPQDVFRTSVVYLASPVYVDAGLAPAGSPVLDRILGGGVATDPPKLVGSEAGDL